MCGGFEKKKVAMRVLENSKSVSREREREMGVRREIDVSCEWSANRIGESKF